MCDSICTSWLCQCSGVSEGVANEEVSGSVIGLLGTHALAPPEHLAVVFYLLEVARLEVVGSGSLVVEHLAQGLLLEGHQGFFHCSIDDVEFSETVPYLSL